jgi:hypothetical protein
VEVSVGVKLAQFIAPELINKITGGIFVLMGTLGLRKEIRSHFNKPKDPALIIEKVESG